MNDKFYIDSVILILLLFSIYIHKLIPPIEEEDFSSEINKRARKETLDENGKQRRGRNGN